MSEVKNALSAVLGNVLQSQAQLEAQVPQLEAQLDAQKTQLAAVKVLVAALQTAIGDDEILEAVLDQHQANVAEAAAVAAANDPAVETSDSPVVGTPS